MHRQIKLLCVAIIIALSVNSAVANKKISFTDKENITESTHSILTIEKSPRQAKRDSIRATKKVWTSILGGPSYSPEASVGIGGAVLMSFKADQKDSVSYRSFLPMGFSISLNGTFILAGSGTLFLNENKLRIYTKYSFRMEPSHYYGVGMYNGDNTERGDSTTSYEERTFNFNNRFMWEVKRSLFVGPLLDVIYTSNLGLSEGVASDPYIQEYNPKMKYTNFGLGASIQYDTRDDIATPSKGMLLSLTGKIYDRYLGSTYSYQMLDFEYRHFIPMFKRRSVLGWTTRAQLSYGDVPFTELPTFGSAYDLRGFYANQYSDKSAAYGIVEYRHMFGSQEAYLRGKFFAKLGFATWVGTGSVGTNPTKWNEWRYNYGVGIRVEIQPGKNFRFDVGKGQGEKGFLFYLNMTEAF